MTEKESFFTPHLQDDEYIIWEGQAVLSFINRLHGTVNWLIEAITLLIPAVLLPFTLIVSFDLSVLFLSIIIWGFIVMMWKEFSTFFSRKKRIEKERNHYTITNKRILLLKNNVLKGDVSLILMQDAVKSKPKNGKSNIHLYNSRSQTGELPPPIATLNNLSEEDAEAAYDLLIHARDISYEERIEDLGLD